MTGHTGQLVVISGPSGSGKTSLIDRLRSHSRVRVSISVTTRPPREDEVDGRNYHFVDIERFVAMEQEGLFIETNDVFGDGHRYGSLWSDLKQAVADPDCVYIMEVDVTGAENLGRTEGLDPRFLFIQPPSLEILEQRLRKRQTDDEQAISRRLGRASAEIEQARAAGAEMVINDSLDQATMRLASLLGLDEANNQAGTPDARRTDVT
jgi:guanylate kinase